MPIRAAVARFFAWAAVYTFALLLGAHMLDTFVLIPHWAASPPASLETWLANPQYPDVAAFMLPLLVAALVVPASSFAAGFRDGPAARRWRGLTAACALMHVALVVVFFVPTNQVLGFLPSEAGTTPAASETIQRLVGRWQVWNGVRIALDALGLYAAVRAVPS